MYLHKILPSCRRVISRLGSVEFAIGRQERIVVVVGTIVVDDVKAAIELVIDLEKKIELSNETCFL